MFAVTINTDMLTTSVIQLTNHATGMELTIGQVSVLKGPLFVTSELTGRECKQTTLQEYSYNKSNQMY